MLNIGINERDIDLRLMEKVLFDIQTALTNTNGDLYSSHKKIRGGVLLINLEKV